MAEVHSIGALAPVSPANHKRRKDPACHKRACAKYERTTKRGFLMRAYRNMQSRILGVQRLKAHLYMGKSLMAKEDFYAWSLASPEFHALFDSWLIGGHERRYTPSVDRIDSALGYEHGNLRWVPFFENCRNIRRRAA